MATADQGDDENRSRQSRGDNPFIRFKNHVDYSVSALLQGLIGLPSALTINHSGNPQWAGFNEDVQRRDELQAGQKRSMDAEPHKTGQNAMDNVPFQGATAVRSGQQTPSANSPDTSAITFSDMPLYSPVNNSLFFNLRASDTKKKGDFGSDFGSLQHAVLNHPNPATFHSQYSLLPYLLFSPYSPLKLSAQEGSSDYCEAFEELIRESHGQPLQSQTPRLLYSNEQRYGRPSYSRFGLSWLDHLHRENLLQKPQPAFKLVESKVEDVQTEQEMYDRFLRLASLPAGSGTGGVLETLLADIEKEFPEAKLEGERALRWLFDEFKSIGPESERTFRSLADELFIQVPKSLELKIKAAREAAERELANKSKLKDQEPTTKFPTLSTKEFEESTLRYRTEIFNTTDKAVSTQTTSKHITRDDGAIETTVTVWKRFADGRESVTTTTHVEEPARHEDGNARQYVGQTEVDTPEEQTKKAEQNSAKKGWFWN